MVNYFDLEFDRVTAHRIEAKSDDQEHSVAIPGNTLLNLDPDTEYKIKQSLFEASDKKNKCFDLRIGSRGNVSFFGIAKDLNAKTQAEYISETGRLSLLLAEAQQTGKIKGSYLITIQAKSADTGRYVFIALKAELTDAMIMEGNQIAIIEDLFLKPDTKFFKFGMLYKYEKWERTELLDEAVGADELDEIDSEWGAFLYDNAFRPESKPAAYFWRDFLGFSIEGNAKIQTKRFYDAVEKFSEIAFKDYDKRKGMINCLDAEVTDTSEEILDPKDFCDKYIHNHIDADNFNNMVVRHLPERIKKDVTLITSKINTKKIAFPGKVKLSAPTSAYDTNIELILDDEQLKNLSTKQESYTIIKVMGKPVTATADTVEPEEERQPEYIENARETIEDMKGMGMEGIYISGKKVV
jgi:hypothetical protein